MQYTCIRCTRTNRLVAVASAFTPKDAKQLGARLGATDSEMFRIRRPDEKPTKSVAHQLPGVVRVFTPKDQLTTQLNETVPLRRVACRRLV